MTDNPFADATVPAAPAAEPAQSEPAPAQPEPQPGSGSTGFGDPFVAPTGGGAGEKVTDLLGHLLLVKPTEYISEMATSKGPTDAVRADIAVLDDAEEPGRVAESVLLFQQALKREARTVLNGTAPYLLGRLVQVETKTGNTMYVFQEFTDEDRKLAEQFLATRKL